MSDSTDTHHVVLVIGSATPLLGIIPERRWVHVYSNVLAQVFHLSRVLIEW